VPHHSNWFVSDDILPTQLPIRADRADTRQKMWILDRYW